MQLRKYESEIGFIIGIYRIIHPLVKKRSNLKTFETILMKFHRIEDPAFPCTD